MISGEPEIGGFHPERVDYLQKGGSRKQHGDIAVFLRGENARQQWCQQIVQKSAEDIAESIPESLGCKLSDAQGIVFRQIYREKDQYGSIS